MPETDDKPDALTKLLELTPSYDTDLVKFQQIYVDGSQIFQHLVSAFYIFLKRAGVRQTHDHLKGLNALLMAIADAECKRLQEKVTEAENDHQK